MKKLILVALLLVLAGWRMNAAITVSPGGGGNSGSVTNLVNGTGLPGVLVGDTVGTNFGAALTANAAQIGAIVNTNESLALRTTNGINYAIGFAPIVQNTYAPNITFGGTNAQIVGTESHSSFVMGGRAGAGYQNIVSNGQWCVINGGYGNQIIGDDDSANNSTISGGELNFMGGRWTVGGYNAFNVIGGGEIAQMGEANGTTFSINNFIGGGRGNRMLGTNVTLSFIGGGGAATDENDGGNWIVNSDFSAILAGQKNRITNGPAMAIGWRQVLTNQYEVKIGYSNNAATISSNGTLTAVALAGNGNAISALSADNLNSGTIPSALFFGIYDQDLFFTSVNNILFASEIHGTDFELLSHTTPYGNAPTGNAGYLWNNSKVLSWVTTTATNHFIYSNAPTIRDATLIGTTRMSVGVVTNGIFSSQTGDTNQLAMWGASGRLTNAVLGTGLSFSGNTLNASASGGTSIETIGGNFGAQSSGTWSSPGYFSPNSSYANNAASYLGATILPPGTYTNLWVMMTFSAGGTDFYFELMTNGVKTGLSLTRAGSVSNGSFNKASNIVNSFVLAEPAAVTLAGTNASGSTQTIYGGYYFQRY